MSKYQRIKISTIKVKSRKHYSIKGWHRDFEFQLTSHHPAIRKLLDIESYYFGQLIFWSVDILTGYQTVDFMAAVEKVL